MDSRYASLVAASTRSVRAALTTLLLALVSACGGGGSGSSSVEAVGPSSPPVVNLSANPATVTSGGTTTLSWTTSNADSCTASGGWTGSRAVNGSAQSAALSANTTFTLNCNGPGGGAVASAAVTISAATATPTVTLAASPPGVAPGGTTTLNWTATNVTTCTASGGWSGSKTLTGSQTTAALNSDQTYQLSCSGANGNALAMTTVTLRSAVLSWSAPTQNVDGSALTNLAGYKVYWGPSSRNYTSNASVTGAGTTNYTTNLVPGTWYFAVTAVDATGAESAKTNEVSKTVF